MVKRPYVQRARFETATFEALLSQTAHGRKRPEEAQESRLLPTALSKYAVRDLAFLVSCTVMVGAVSLVFQRSNPAAALLQPASSSAAQQPFWIL